MRENRLYGSAGGGARERSPYPHWQRYQDAAGGGAMAHWPSIMLAVTSPA